MRVSMSAIGSVIMMDTSPARLGHARDFSGMRHFSETHTTQAELAQH
jgi:threonine dehydrogenase-like Zn-dependent dehydrogenase